MAHWPCFLHMRERQHFAAHFQCDVVIRCLRQLWALVLHRKLVCFPPSETSFDHYHSLGRMTVLSIQICDSGRPMGRVLFPFKFGAPLLHVLQEFQGRNQKGTCNCASGPVLTAKINDHHGFLVPWPCDENPRSFQKACVCH